MIKEYYSNEMMKKYDGKSLGELPPHVYAIGVSKNDKKYLFRCEKKIKRHC